MTMPSDPHHSGPDPDAERSHLTVAFAALEAARQAAAGRLHAHSTGVYLSNALDHSQVAQDLEAAGDSDAAQSHRDVAESALQAAVTNVQARTIQVFLDTAVRHLQAAEAFRTSRLAPAPQVPEANTPAAATPVNVPAPTPVPEALPGPTQSEPESPEVILTL